MSRKVGDKNYFTFVKGINTEAGPLTFPDNTALDIENIDLFTDGSARKRLGVDYEEAAQLITSGVEWDGAVKIFDWKSPGGDATKHFIVIQSDTGYLYVYQVNSGGTYTLIGSASLLTISGPPPGAWAHYEVQIASANGYLFCVHPYSFPMMLEYDPNLTAGSQITRNLLSVNIRDFDGIYENTTVDNKPATLTDQHKYNLLNQGWLSSNVVTYGTPYPSRAMLMSQGKDKSPQSVAGTYDVWTKSVQDTALPNATPAPTGHFVVHALSVARATYITGTPNNDSTWTIATTWNEQAATSFRTVASFAGRVWYSGLTTATYNTSSIKSLVGNVYFSQIIHGQSSNAQSLAASSCHQEADPTSESINELVSSDGGVIAIPEAGTITKLYPLDRSILVFSEKGVWEITGGQAGFKATEFAVRKITSSGIASPSSVVAAGSSLYYCGIDGIISISPNQQAGLLEATNISFNSVQSLYNEIPDTNKGYITGVYDNHLNKIIWLYYDGSYPSTTNGTFYYLYNKALILDINLGAFYKYSFTHVDGTDLSSSNWTTTPFIVGISHQPNYGYTVGNNYIESADRDIKFISLSKESNVWGVRTCLINNTSFLDWESFDSTGVALSAYLEAGHETLGDAVRRKDAKYIHCFFNRTEANFVDDGSGNAVFDNPSGCLMQIKWEWADHSNSGKYSQQQEVYRFRREYTPTGTLPESFDSGFPVVVSKNKVRGSGKSMRVRFDTESGKDCWLLGWSTNFGVKGEI